MRKLISIASAATLAVLTFASGWIWNGTLARDIRSVTLLVLTVISASISLCHLFV